MTLFITIYNLKNIKHRTNKYAISSMYFLNIKNEKRALAKITREIYLIDNFKTNILIENNLINLEKIVINIINKFAHINNYDVIVNLKAKTTRTIVYERVYIKKIVNVFSKFEITILIYYT